MFDLRSEPRSGSHGSDTGAWFHPLEGLVSSLGDAARQHQWVRAEESPPAAELLSADTSCAGAEAVGNKEPRSSRTCPGKTPHFALIILFFSILHPHNNVSRPVSLYWFTQRIHSEIQIFLEHDHAPVPSSGKKGSVVSLFPCCFSLSHANMDFATWVWGCTPCKTPKSVWVLPFRASLCVRCLLGTFLFQGSWIHKAPVFAVPQEFVGSVKSLGAPCRGWLGISPLHHLQAEATG